jgi:UDP-N-acetyl-D-mannosaminuronic acid transferase (WecB/TagA/CpsF family)
MTEAWNQSSVGNDAKRTATILGVPFITNSAEEAVRIGLKGGLVVVPAGPPLAGELITDTGYREALINADIVLPDSGAMVLGWNLRNAFASKRRIARLSGLKYLIVLLRELARRPDLKTFWIMPSVEDQDANLRWLRKNGFPGLTQTECYVAPKFTKRDHVGNRIVEDPALLEHLERQRPDVIVVNIGGGTQELLGWYLKRSLPWKPLIVCTGAAIAFLSGRQARIPSWADKFYLGWLMRVMREPAKFIPRYAKALRLFALIAKYGERAPWRLE